MVRLRDGHWSAGRMGTVKTRNSLKGLKIQHPHLKFLGSFPYMLLCISPESVQTFWLRQAQVVLSIFFWSIVWAVFIWSPHQTAFVSVTAPSPFPKWAGSGSQDISRSSLVPFQPLDSVIHHLLPPCNTWGFDALQVHDSGRVWELPV